ncbi:hypothetical protein SBRCBS47491_004868 [Sporothrix bragantina]|uniref:amidase n=1 Tax=Sporothrix bragantina TaxID=671064 RepID=A0ABP0BS18_9PEZI
MTEVASLPGSTMPSHGGLEMTQSSVKAHTAASKKILPWQSIVAAKQAQLKTAIPEAWRIDEALLDTVDFSLESTQSLDSQNSTILRDSKILSDHELAITEEYNAGELLAKLASGKLTALEVTVAFSKRAAIAQQLAKMFFDEAEQRARYLDDYLAREGKVLGPLHGLPISLKDSFNLAGVQSTIGYVSFLGRPVPTTNGALVDLLLELGAVLYVKTNIPQTLMTADSENNIFGRTRNPRKMNLTAGGSSGGEGALVAFRGSLIGVGTDIAGSIRIPALCCGVYGFKPTTSRVPYTGQTSPGLPGMPGILACAGPLATTMDDLQLFFKAVLDGKPWTYDAVSAAVPYQQTAASELASKKVLRIGLMPEEPRVPLHPPVRRALDNATAALRKAGHEIVPISHGTYTSALNACTLALRFFGLDATNVSLQHIVDSGEPMIATVAASLALPLPEDFGTTAIESVAATPAHRQNGYGIADLAALNVERALFQNAWRCIFRDQKLDVVLSPGAQHTAPKHDTYGMPAYTVFWNLLDYPACIIPYGKASKDLDPTESAAKTVDNPKYDAEAFDGAPTAVQVIAPRFQDELCLEAAARIDAVLNGEQFSVKG